jgi:integrase
LRRAEAQRLDWSRIDFLEGHVDLGTVVAKTGSRRLAPLPDSAAAWLKPLAKISGPLGIGETPYADDLCAARARAGIETWEGNELRHSFGSYRLALLGDAVVVAAQMGNSAAKVHAHYKSLVTKKAAERYFDVVPSREATVVPFSKVV